MRAHPTTSVVKTLRHFIGGMWTEAEAVRTEDLPNPATGEVHARVPYGGPAAVDAAVRAAAAASAGWRETPPVERARILFRYRDLLEGRIGELARSVTDENGKTLEEARGEVRRGIEVVEFACGAPTLLMGAVLEDVARGIDSEVVRAPVGVVAGICPFNFPAMIPLWMMPIALVCGNTFVLKPSERTPLTAVHLTELLMQAGLPAGVLNLVHGAKEAVDAILSHDGVRAVSFVGSAPVARYVYQTAAAYGKRVQALAGAKNHLVVMPDADLERTASAVLSSAFGNAGERCLAGSVVVAVGDIADRIVPALCAGAARLHLGAGWDPSAEMGPLIRADHRARVVAHIDRTVAAGAALVLDGRATAQQARGYFLGPSIFDHVRPEMAIAQEEIFGPVLAVIRVPDLAEALRVVNASHFGNMACIFTKSGQAAREFRTRVEAGMVGINIGVAAPMAFFPFVGWKGSFYGDLHATGRDAVEFYTERRVVTTRWF